MAGEGSMPTVSHTGESSQQACEATPSPVTGVPKGPCSHIPFFEGEICLLVYFCPH